MKSTLFLLTFTSNFLPFIFLYCRYLCTSLPNLYFNFFFKGMENVYPLFIYQTPPNQMLYIQFPENPYRINSFNQTKKKKMFITLL